MLKKIFNKVDHFIQWTKKWHFFHIVFVGPLTFLITYFFVLIPLIIIQNPPSQPITTDEFDIDIPILIFCAGFIVIIFIILLFFACFVQLVLFLISLINKKTCYVRNNFLLHNKFYNKYYEISTFVIFISNITILLTYIIVNIFF